MSSIDTTLSHSAFHCWTNTHARIPGVSSARPADVALVEAHVHGDDAQVILERVRDEAGVTQGHGGVQVRAAGSELDPLRVGCGGAQLRADSGVNESGALGRTGFRLVVCHPGRR